MMILGQSTPGDTNVHILVDATIASAVDVDWISVCNNHSSAVAARLFVSYDGSTADTTTALWYDLSVAANSIATWELPFRIRKGGTVQVRSANADKLTFTASGTRRA